MARPSKYNQVLQKKFVEIVKNIVCAVLKKKKIDIEIKNVECYSCGKRFKPELNGLSCSGGYPPNIKQYHFCSQECFFVLMDKCNVETDSNEQFKRDINNMRNLKEK